MKESTSFNDYEKGKKGAVAKSRKGAARSMRIEKLDDGSFTTETDHDVPEGAEKPMYMMHDRSRTKASHPSVNHMKRHIAVTFGGEPEDQAASDKEKGTGAAKQGKE